MSQEAALVIVVYFLIGALVLFASIMVHLYLKLKALSEEAREFVKLMVTLYEEEKRKNERRDESY